MTDKVVNEVVVSDNPAPVMPQAHPAATTSDAETTAAERGHKPLIYMLCAHEPDEDPRVDWTASMAAADYNVVVLGLEGWRHKREEHEKKNGYEILRFNRSGSTAQAMKAVLQVLLPRALAGIAKSPTAIVLAILLAPIVVIGEVFARVLVAIWRGLGRVIAPLAPRLSIGISRSLLHGRRPATMHAWNDFQWMFRHVFVTGEKFYLYLKSSEKPTLIHCNDLDTLLAGVLYSTETGVPVVYDSHENWPYSHVGAGWYHIRFFRMLERFLIKRCAAVVTVSDPLAEFLKREYKLDTVEVVPNCTPWRGVSPRPKDGTMADLAAGRLKVLFQGSFAAERGIEEVIDAWRMVDGSQAALFLRGPDNLVRQQLIERTRGYGLLDTSVFFLPPVTEDELVTAAAEADIGLIPYKPHSPAYRVACPNKLSQYMHAGLPIVAVNLPYVEKVLEAGACGITYKVEDPGSFVEAIMRFVREPGLIATLSTNAYAHAESDFNWQKYGKVFSSIYRRLSPIRNTRVNDHRDNK